MTLILPVEEILLSFRYGELEELIEYQKQFGAEIYRIESINQTTPLHMASANGHLELVKEIISVDKNFVNKKNSDGNTALHWAALNGQLNVVTYLVDNGAIIEIKNELNVTATMMAIQNHHDDVIDYLFEKTNLE